MASLEVGDQWAEGADEYDARVLDVGAFATERGSDAALNTPVPSFRTVNLDTGAAVTAVPRHWAGDEVGSPSAVPYRTASGVILRDEGRIRIGARTEVGLRRT